MQARLSIHNVGNRKTITVPRAIARLIPDGQEFIAELTEDGILYRAVDPEEIALPEVLPRWLQGEE
jgi:hypothetical protein